jgi:hypothetical protein
MDNYEEYSLMNTTKRSRVEGHHRFGEHISSTFRVQDKAKEVSSKMPAARRVWLDNSLAYSSKLKMEAAYSSEMSVNFCRTTRC